MTWLYSLFLVKGTYVSVWHTLTLAFPVLQGIFSKDIRKDLKTLKLDKDFNGVRTREYNETKFIRYAKKSTTKYTSCLQQGSKGTTKRHKTQEITALL